MACMCCRHHGYLIVVLAALVLEGGNRAMNLVLNTIWCALKLTTLWWGAMGFTLTNVV